MLAQRFLISDALDQFNDVELGLDPLLGEGKHSLELVFVWPKSAGE